MQTRCFASRRDAGSVRKMRVRPRISSGQQGSGNFVSCQRIWDSSEGETLRCCLECAPDGAAPPSANHFDFFQLLGVRQSAFRLDDRQFPAILRARLWPLACYIVFVMPSAFEIPVAVRKATQALNYFACLSASGAPFAEINKMKALKLLFFADRYHLRKYGRPV